MRITFVDDMEHQFLLWFTCWLAPPMAYGSGMTQRGKILNEMRNHSDFESFHPSSLQLLRCGLVWLIRSDETKWLISCDGSSLSYAEMTMALRECGIRFCVWNVNAGDGRVIDLLVHSVIFIPPNKFCLHLITITNFLPISHSLKVQSLLTVQGTTRWSS